MHCGQEGPKQVYNLFWCKLVVSYSTEHIWIPQCLKSHEKCIENVKHKDMGALFNDMIYHIDYTQNCQTIYIIHECRDLLKEKQYFDIN